jgi:hypothetical protein
VAPQRIGVGVWIAAFAVLLVAAGAIGFSIIRTTRSSHTHPALIAGNSVQNSPSAGTAPDGGVLYRSAAGHFAARFPKHPTEGTLTQSVQGVDIKAHFAADQPSRTIVEADDFSRAFPSDLMDQVLRRALVALTTTSDLTLDNQTATTFQGRPARQAQYTSAKGSTLTALVVAYNSKRVYLLYAQSGPAFDSLRQSFVAIP